MTKKQELLKFMDNCFKKGFTVALAIKTPDCPLPNTTIHPPQNIKAMSDFYSNAYTDDLVHSMNKEVQIISWSE